MIDDRCLAPCPPPEYDAPDVDADDLLGTDRYVIERRMGSGSFGVVYAVTDRRRQRRVALKLLRRLRPSDLYHFKQEFRSLCGLEHPNLARLYELTATGERWYFTMELVDGVDFLAHVRGQDGEAGASTDVADPGPRAPAGRHAGPRAPSGALREEAACGVKQRDQSTAALRAGPSNATSELVSDRGMPAHGAPATGRRAPMATAEGSILADATQADGDPAPRLARGAARAPPPLDPARLRPALRQLAQGIQALHQAGKLHRDIKPSNVLVTEEGRVVLLDFGLVTELAEPERLGAAGTPAYMAPEQARADLLCPASDWYSVGVMLFEALTGRRPFAGDRQVVLQAKQDQDPPPPHVINPDAPADLSELCIALLARDPARRPGGTQILARLGAHDRRPAEAPFIGRLGELEQLCDAFDASQGGRTVVVQLHGSSGIGKTALVQAFAAQQRAQRQAVVLFGRCHEQESVPFKAVDNLIDRLCNHLRQLDADRVAQLLPAEAWTLARLFPAFERVAPLTDGAPAGHRPVLDRHELRQSAFDALRELLRRLAGTAPLLLIIDDLHWGDLDSAALLADLLRPPEPPPMLMVLTFRSEERERSPVLRLLLGQRWVPTPVEVRELELGPMGEEEATVAAQILAGMHGVAASAMRVVREARGSPLFLQALIRHEAHRGSTAEAPPTLRRALAGQIRLLGGEERRLLEAVVLDGQPVDEEVALAAAGGGDPLVLRTQHLVRSSSRAKLEPYHDQIAQTVVEMIPEEQRRQRHLELALAHEAAGGAAPDLLAMHWRNAGDLLRAAPYAHRAADRAFEVLAFERAARLYRVALQLAPPRTSAHRRLQVGLAEALAHSGQGTEAAEAFLVAVRDCDPAEVGSLRRRAVYELFACGHVEEAQQTLEAMMAEVGIPRPRSGWSTLLFLLTERVRFRLRGLGFRRAGPASGALLDLLEVLRDASVILGLRRPMLGAGLHTRYARVALDSGDPVHIALALGHELSILSWRGTRGGARLDRMLELMRALCQEVDDPLVESEQPLWVAGLEMMRGRWRSALENAERACELHRVHGYHYYWDYTHGLSLLARFMLGDLAEVARRLPRHLRQAEEEGKVLVTTSLRIFSYVLWLAADRPEEGRRVLRSVPDRDVGLLGALQVVAEINFDLYDGKARRAWERIEEQRSQPALPGLRRMQIARIIGLWSRTVVDLAAAAQSEGSQRRELLREAEWCARRLAAERAPWADALAAYANGAAAATRGEAQAPDLLERAVRLARAADMELLAMMYSRRLGQLQEQGALIVATDAALVAQGIVNPARFCMVYAPWPPDQKGGT